MANEKTALVLSAGGMFGAYQAGAWRALAEIVEPDLVIGASIGSLNGWAIAGGCDPQDWLETWLSLAPAEWPRYRLPRSPLEGVMDPCLFEEWVQKVHSSFTPCVPYGAVITQVPRMRPRVVQTPHVTWQHLAASCAVPGLLPLRRIDGILYADGGVLNALPLWAAAEMGATRIIAVNVLEQAPITFRCLVRGLRSLAPAAPALPTGVPVVTIAPAACLGGSRDAFYWRRETAQRWAEAGYRDVRDKEHVIRGMF